MQGCLGQLSSLCCVMARELHLTNSILPPVLLAGLAVKSLEAACSQYRLSLGWPDAAVLY